ncbi:MAG: hypothetical protein HQL50_03395 [Magnetococcales bacterium]|nr:hypothetical protein [Magnetococcales bacterium]
MSDSFRNTVQPNYYTATVVLALIFLTAVSINQFLVFDGKYMHAYDKLLLKAYHVTNGMGEWKTFQNRLLGPYTVLLLTELDITYATASRIFYLFFTIVTNISFFLIYYTYLGSVSRALYLTSFFILVSILLPHHFHFYVWDQYDLLFFTIFSGLVLFRKSDIHYVVLFFIALLNRESALFIGVWLCIDSFMLSPAASGGLPKVSLVNRNRLAMGMALIVIGIILTITVRELLFHNSSSQTISSGSFSGNLYPQALIINLHSLWNDFTYYNKVFYVHIYFLCFLFFLYLNRQTLLRLPPSAQKVALLILSYLIMTFMFSIFKETRTHTLLIPLGCVFYILGPAKWACK